LVHEDERSARADFLVMEIGAATGGFWHGRYCSGPREPATRRRGSRPQPDVDQGKFASRMSKVFLPLGSCATTESPTRLPMRARARGASTEMRPLAGSARS